MTMADDLKDVAPGYGNNKDEEEGDIELEIVDDTPPEDRGRPKLGKQVEDPSDEELSEYSDKVKARIAELTHARHDERREKEALAREREEYERTARMLADENRRLKSYVATGETAYAGSLKEAAEAEVSMAQRELKEAHEAFDTDGIVAAQTKLSEALMKKDRAASFKPTMQPQETVVQTQPAAPQPDRKTLSWQARNQWYGQPGFEEYTSYALGLHHKLVNAGVDPRTGQYFEQIDARLKKTFPELFGANGNEQSEEHTSPSETPKKQPASIVAPASRSTGTKKIQLTTRQLELARKYGLTPQQYAAEVAKLEKQNG